MEQMGVLWNALYGVRVIDGVGAVHLVLEASIETFGALPTIATALGNVAAAGFLLWAFQRAFLAPQLAMTVALEARCLLKRPRA